MAIIISQRIFDLNIAFTDICEKHVAKCDVTLFDRTLVSLKSWQISIAFCARKRKGQQTI